MRAWWSGLWLLASVAASGRGDAPDPAAASGAAELRRPSDVPAPHGADADGGGADAEPSGGAQRVRPRSIVFRPRAPNALGFHTIHIECMPNSGCTLFAEFICGQLLSTGAAVACFPDIFDCTALVPRRADESAARPHHYVAKVKTWPIWGDAAGREVEPPPEIERSTGTLAAWAEVSPSAHILFGRDPLQNYLSLRSKAFCSACGGMRSHFAHLDRLFARDYAPYAAHADAQAALFAEGRAPPLAEAPAGAAGASYVGGYAGYWDAVLFAEDMAEPRAFLSMLAALLGRSAVGHEPIGVRQFGMMGWQASSRNGARACALWHARARSPARGALLVRARRASQAYQHKRLAAHDAALGYRWAGIPVNGSSAGRYFSKGKALRFGSGNSRIIYDSAKSFYAPTPKRATAGEQGLARFLAPAMAAAYAGGWQRPAPTGARGPPPAWGTSAGAAPAHVAAAIVAQVGLVDTVAVDESVADGGADAAGAADARAPALLSLIHI